MKKYIYIITCLLFLFLQEKQFSQSRSFKVFTANDGLAANSVFSMIQDSKGYLWFGTDAGLSKFDGHSFTTYSGKDGVISGKIWSLFEDNNGTIWVGGENGISRRIEDKFNVESIDSIYVYDINQDVNGRIWIATLKNGVYYYENGKFQKYNKLKKELVYRSIINDPQGNVIISSLGGGIFKITSQDSIINYNSTNTGIKDSVYSTFNGNNGELYLGAINGIDIINGDKHRFLNLTKLNSDFSIRKIISDIKGDLWFITYEGGLQHFNGLSTLVFSDEKGLPSNQFLSGLRDYRGDLWFGSRDGLVYLATEMIEVYDESSGLANNIVYSIGEDEKGNFWFGHEVNGLSVLHPTKIGMQNITTEDGLNNNGVATILKDSKNRMWFGTFEGVSKYENEEFEVFAPDSNWAGDLILTIEEDQQGNIWFGGQEGATKFDGENFTKFNVNNGLPADWINDIYRDRKGNLWFASDEEGVAKFDGLNFKYFNKDDGLANNNVLCIEEDSEGNMWFGTDGNGISKYDGNKFLSVTSSDGLSSDVCYSIVAYEKYIFVGTNQGITRIEYNAIEEKGKAAFNIYSYETGLPSNEMTGGGKFLDSKQNIWFASHGGLIKINPANKPNLVPPPIYIDNVRIIEGASRYDTNYTSIFELEYSQNNLRFDFNSISFSHPENLVYYYKLEGISDTNWVETKVPQASYPFLPPGDYKFLVKSINNDGIWSLPVELPFIINPPFYSTWWFTSIMFILALSGIYGFYVFKTQQVKKRNIELANTVRERTKELRVEKSKSDDLLLNILPESLVTELKEAGRVKPREFKNISILFTDFKGFTYTSSVLPADKLVNELNDIFRGFDEIIVKYKCEKLKTIGDAYMAGAGLPVETEDHAIRTVLAADAMIKFIEKRNQESAIKWEMRAGVHSGNVIAGVVGTKKFTYDIWGDTVNIASRMESSGEPGKINISAYTYMLIRDHFDCEYRGKIDAKGKGKVDMYFVNNVFNRAELYKNLGIES